MKTTFAQDRAILEQAGISFPAEVKHYLEDAAQPGLLTTPNGGIPAFLLNYLDPKFVEIIVAPMKAAEIAGERGIASLVDATYQVPVVEYAGEVSSYGDWNNNGSSTANVNWVPRQQYIYQGIAQWGDLELERMGRGKIDWANRIKNAKALAFNKFQNKSYFYGISGLQNYGLLNDPNLTPAITPTTKAASGTAWANATANEVYQDIQNIFSQLQLQLNGNIDLSSKLILAMSPTSEVALTKTTQFNVNVMDMLKKNFPNLEVKTAPEYATAAGQLVQMIAPEVQGQEVLTAAFSEKMRAFPVFRDISAYKQKFAAGTWGTIIYIPVAISEMLGV